VCETGESVLPRNAGAALKLTQPCRIINVTPFVARVVLQRRYAGIALGREE
jgi:hypothetical protein